MRWGPRYDFTIGEQRLFSMTTGTQRDGTEEMLLTGYGAGEDHAHQHVYFRREGSELVSGGSVLRQGNEHISTLSLDTHGPALVAAVEAHSDPTLNTYDVKLEETIAASTVSSVLWNARPSRHETHQLPGQPDPTQRWDLTLGIGDQVAVLRRAASNSSMATMVELLPESSAALLVTATRPSP